MFDPSEYPQRRATLAERFPIGLRVRHIHPDWSTLVGSITPEPGGDDAWWVNGTLDAVHVTWDPPVSQGSSSWYSAEWIAPLHPKGISVELIADTAARCHIALAEGVAQQIADSLRPLAEAAFKPRVEDIAAVTFYLARRLDVAATLDQIDRMAQHIRANL